MAPMSTPRVGWPTSSRSGFCSISRATTIFCWLPPENFLAASSGIGGRTSNFSIFPSVSAQGVIVHEQRVLLVGGVVVIAEGHVLPGGEVHDQAKMVAVLGHMGDAGVARRLAVGPLAGQGICAALQHLPRPVAACRPALQQFGLAVAGDAGDAEDLAGADLEADALQPLDLVFVAHPQVPDLQHDLARAGGALLDLQQHLAARPSARPAFGAGLGGLHRRRPSCRGASR
jgi:hypothetical protein